MTINSDSYQDIHLFYSKLSQSNDIAAGTTTLLPTLQSCPNAPDFYKIIVPSQDNSFFAHVHNAYLALSNCIYTFIRSKDTISDQACVVKSICSELSTSTDGFQYVSLILHRTLPQFGGPQIKLTDELTKLKIQNGEMLSEYHTRALRIQSNILFSNITISKTLFHELYLDNLKKTQLFHHLQHQIRKFNTHRRLYGDNTSFTDSIADVYQELLDSGIPSNDNTYHHLIFFVLNSLCTICKFSYAYPIGTSCTPPCGQYKPSHIFRLATRSINARTAVR